MRRSRNMDHGGGLSRQNVSTGPLMSDHIKNLDLELELLKRKREMLEQQQTIYQPFTQQIQQRNYNQQTYTYNENVGQGSSNRDFSMLYDDGPQQNRKSYPKKRPSDNSWQHDSYPKKSAGYGRGYTAPSPVQNRNSFSSTNRPKKGYQARSPVRGRPFIGQRITNQKPQIPERNFVPKKVMKSTKASAPPNKIASQPVAERGRLVTITMKSVAKAEINKQEANRLLPDTEPTPQMRGRMEMILGTILSNVREIYADSPHLMTLRTAPYQRIIKQFIRDRIRTALLGKIVGNTREILQEYRNMFPKETDRDIVNEAIKAIRPEHEEKSVKSVVSENNDHVQTPHEMFRENVLSLLNSHLCEMFNKIEEIYNNEPDETENNDSNKNLEENEEIATVSKEQSTEDVSENNEDSTKNNVAVIDNITSDDVVKNKDPFKMYTEFHNMQLKEIKAKGDAAAANLGITDQTVYKRLLTRVIKNYIPVITKMVNTNKMYRETVGQLISSSKDKNLENKEGPVVGKDQQPEDSKEKSETELTQETSAKKKGPYPLPYYVKLMGKPQLPKKNVMQSFLDSFNPKSIKKHRSIYNLLFIGFTEKSGFDAIVKANGTVIGRNTLSIRICEYKENKTGENPEDRQNISENTASTLRENKESNIEENAETNIIENAETNIDSSADALNKNSEDLNSSKDDIFGSDLNEQIDDLLNTVKESNENSSENLDDTNVEKTSQIDNVVDDENKASKDNANENDKTVSNEVRLENEQSDAIETQDVNSDSNNLNADNNDGNEMKNDIDHKEVNFKNETENKEDNELKNEKIDQVSAITGPTVRSTPTRASSRLSANAASTPSSIRTRGAHKLAQN